MALFRDCSVLFELKGLPFKEKKKIKLAVTNNGGRMSYVANKECSLIVTNDVSSLSHNRLRNTVRYRIPVVGINYVLRCVEADCRLPVEDFKLDVSSAHDPPASYTKEKSFERAVSSKPYNVQAKPLEAVSAAQNQASPKGRGSVIENYRVYSETDRGLPEFPENFQVAKYSLYQKSNGRTWCLLELQSAKSERGRTYRVVRYWMDDIQAKKAAVRDQMVFVSTSEEAVKVYQALMDSVKKDGLKQQSHVPPQVTEMGSAPLQQLLLEEKLHTESLSQEVGQFVELLWQEALGCIDLILNTPVHKISLNDVTRAEGLLLQVQRQVMGNENDELPLKVESVLLLSEYGTLLPQRSRVMPDMSSISKQFDLCQLIRDILNMSEMTLGSTVPSSVGKYRALRCSIEAVPKGSSEFEIVTSLLQHSQVQVHQILRVNRAPELQSFKSGLGNIKSMLHSSGPHNFVGILSRGLLMPCVAVSQHGIQRTDAGDLGSGIYFTDNINTTLKYSQCSLTDGSRLLLVCDVALGQCKDLFKKDLTLTRAPEGHDSVHGVHNKPGRQSEFTDDQYVVYSPDQVKLKYVVRLSLEGDELKNFAPEIVQSEEPHLPFPPNQAEVEDGIVDIKNPLDSVTAGLLNSSGQQIPLQEVHVKCKLVDLLAQVIIFQKYTNESSVPIEAKYVFPLDDSAAVCGFEAFINGKHVVGQVKEKETARREYKQAVEKGHGAYLMDQDAPDVFTISVGNLPPGAAVLIKVTFVSELIVKDGSIFFSLPSSVAPWQESAALNQTTQVTVKKVNVTDEEASTRDFTLDMSIEMPHEITEVKCLTHQVKMKKTDCKAVVSVLSGEVMGSEGFQLLVTLTEVHVPRMWVEQHPSKDSQACMLVFYPKFEAASSNTSDEVVLLLDASQSMKGESFNSARMIALQILKSLNSNIPVNVIFFSTDHTDAFLFARPIDEVRQEAKNFIKRFSSAGGSTELWRPLRALNLLPPSSGTRNLLLLSDGHIQNTELTLQLLRDHAPHTRLFTCGLSPTANRHMLRALAQAGGGAYEFFDSKSKHTWSEKVASQVKRVLAPGASSVSVKWQQFNPTAPPPLQAPKQLHALFNDCHTLVYGFVPHCKKATLLGNLSGQEIETMVSTSELQTTKGTFLHKLTARAIIRDFEDGSLDSNAVLHEENKAKLKSTVIELSKEFSILSQFTSFVAIEERDSEQEEGFTDIPKVIAEEDVDFLPYMSWESAEETEEKELMCPVQDLLLPDDIECVSFSEEDDLMGLTDYAVDEMVETGMGMDAVFMTKEIDIEMSSSFPGPDSPDTPPPIPPVHHLHQRKQKKIMQIGAPVRPLSTLPAPPPLPKMVMTTQMGGLFGSALPQGHLTSTWSADAFGYERAYKPTSARLSAPPPPPPAMATPASVEESLESRPKIHRKLRLCSLRSSKETPPPPPPPAMATPAIVAESLKLRPTVYERLSRSSLRSSEETPPPPPPPAMATPAIVAESLKLRPTIYQSLRHGSLRSSEETPPPPPPPAMATPAIVEESLKLRPTIYESLSCGSLRSSKETRPPPPPPGMAAPPYADSERRRGVISRTGSVSHAMFFAKPQKSPLSFAVSNILEEPLSDDMAAPPVLNQSEPQLFGFGSSGVELPSLVPLREQGVADLPVSLKSITMIAPIQTQPQLLSVIGSVETPKEEVESALRDQSEPALLLESQSLSFGGFGGQAKKFRRSRDRIFPKRCSARQEVLLDSDEATSHKVQYKHSHVIQRAKPLLQELSRDKVPKWPRIFNLQHTEGYWELSPELGVLLNCDIVRFADDFLNRKGIASLGIKAHTDILKLLATLLVLQLMRLEKLMEGQLLRTLLYLEDSELRPEHWEAVNRAVEWARWADRQYPCIYSRLEFGLSWDSSTKQLLGVERIHHCSPLTGLNLNPRPMVISS